MPGSHGRDLQGRHQQSSEDQADHDKGRLVEMTVVRDAIRYEVNRAEGVANADNQGELRPEARQRQEHALSEDDCLDRQAIG